MGSEVRGVRGGGRIIKNSKKEKESQGQVSTAENTKEITIKTGNQERRKHEKRIGV